MFGKDEKTVDILINNSYFSLTLLDSLLIILFARSI